MRVVVVGGGFGGVRTALLLANKKDLQVTLISDHDYFEYHAALYRSATGRSPLEVTIPLSDFFGYAKNVKVVKDKVVGLDPDKKVVIGQSDQKYGYGALVLALGNVTEYYNIPGLEKNSFGVKTIHEAMKLKKHLHDELIGDDIEKNYVVVGAGATGVELSAELTKYIKKIRRKHKIRKHFTIDLIEAAPRAVSNMPVSFSRGVQKRLRKLGVRLMLKTAVKSETIDTIKLPKGSLKTHTVIWTAGVANNPFFKKFPNVFRFGKSGRVEVDDYLQAAPNIYVIGDSAVTEYSGMAQTALHDANFVSKNILLTMHERRPKKYKPKKPIYAIPVGPHWAAVLWGNVKINGRLGWFVRRLADLRLYLKFLTIGKALTTWRYGFVEEEVCKKCH